MQELQDPGCLWATLKFSFSNYSLPTSLWGQSAPIVLNIWEEGGQRGGERGCGGDVIWEGFVSRSGAAVTE